MCLTSQLCLISFSTNCVRVTYSCNRVINVVDLTLNFLNFDVVPRLTFSIDLRTFYLLICGFLRVLVKLFDSYRLDVCKQRTKKSFTIGKDASSLFQCMDYCNSLHAPAVLDALSVLNPDCGATKRITSSLGNSDAALCRQIVIRKSVRVDSIQTL